MRMGDICAADAVRDWITVLGGRPAQARSFAASPVLAVGRFHFDVLNDEVEAPRLPLHYVSVSLAGPLRIEARLEGEKVKARVARGQAMIMAAGRANAWRWDRPTEEAHVFLRPDFLADIADDLGGGEAMLLDRLPFSDTRLSDTIVALADEIASGTAVLPLFFDMAAAALGRRLLRHCDGGKDVRGGNAFLTGRQLRRVLALADERLGEAIGLADLADAAGMSRFQFIRAFKSAVGVSPYRWLVAMRVERAKELLARTRAPIIEVATSLGFESQSHFGQVFQAHVGKTPTEWRRSVS
jgi:AraC family transcriptional regulator